jgi:O-antigen/teichoic acid export membrane protein
MSATTSSLQLLRSLFLLAKNNAVVAALSYALTISLANVLGPNQFGVYSQALIVASVLSILISFGTDQTAPVAYVRSKDADAVVSQVLAMRSTIALICAAWLICSPSMVWPLAGFVACLALPSFNLSFLYEIRQNNARYSYIYLFERITYVGIGFLLIYFGVLSLQRLFTALLLVTALSLAFQIWDTGLRVRANVAEAFSALSNALVSNWPLVVVALSMFAYGGFSRILLERKLGMEALGVYSAGWQLITIGTLYQAQITRLWRATISEAVHAGDLVTLKSALRSYFLLAVLPMVGGAVFLWFQAGQLVDVLFSRAYAGLVDLIPIFGIYFVVISFSGLAEMLWVALRKNKTYMVVNVLFGIFLLQILTALPKEFGMVVFAGAAVAVHALATLALVITWILLFCGRLKERQDSSAK